MEPKLYDVVYADPPWNYSFSPSKSRRIENHYPTMPLSEICELQVPAKNDSVLYLWATAPKLVEALAVIEAWGFRYKTHCIWDKQLVGMGHWFRGQHELLLVGTRGTFSPPLPSDRIPSILAEKRTRHSRKPAVVRDLIGKWFPEASKIEYFARDRAPGWDAWGNEVHDSTCAMSFGEEMELLSCTCEP